jgi:hypothetical protein
MKTGKILDLLIWLLCIVGNVFLFKVVLNSIGYHYNFEFFYHLNWKQYWGVSAISSMYIIGTTIRLNTKEDKTEKSEYPLTTSGVTTTLMILLVWGLSSAIAMCF